MEIIEFVYKCGAGEKSVKILQIHKNRKKTNMKTVCRAASLFTNPATADCGKSGWRIISFSYNTLDGPDQYTRDLKYPRN